jgi:malonyl-CoA O-methyltransferase
MARIERDLVKKSFSSHAGQYDSHAVVQKRVISRFIEILKNSNVSPTSILDVGAGTGKLLGSLGEMFPNTDLAGVDLAFGMTKRAKERHTVSPKSFFICADAEHLPFRENCFDLIVSTSTYQWIDPLAPAFTEIYRLLKPGSQFHFALFGEKTLFELKESYKSASAFTDKSQVSRTHEFSTPENVLVALDAAGFTECLVNSELEVEIHPNVPALLRAVKGVGAKNAARSPDSGLSGRSVMERMMEIYRDKYSTNGGITATYHVLYGSGLKTGHHDTR